MLKYRENTIAQFFTDSGFIPPKGRSIAAFGFGFDTNIDSNMDKDGYDGIPDSILDITQGIHDGSEHPIPGIYGDYYMFNDPGTRTNSDLRSPLSQDANQINTEYHRKNLDLIQSASDVHLEPLEQPAAEFPRHAQIKSQMEPSVLDSDKATLIDQSGIRLPRSEELILQQPTMFEGIEYPAGTRLFIEDSTDDTLYEDPRAKLCPLCFNPYVGDACTCVKNAIPGPNAIRVKAGKE